MKVVLPASTDAPRLAREAARRFLDGDAEAGSALDDVLLVVSELVTNAIEHGEGEPHLTITNVDHELRVAVRDHGAGRPVLQDPLWSHVTGRGLFIVSHVVDGWGVEHHPEGTTVWATFHPFEAMSS